MDFGDALRKNYAFKLVAAYKQIIINNLKTARQLNACKVHAAAERITADALDTVGYDNALKTLTERKHTVSDGLTSS